MNILIAEDENAVRKGIEVFLKAQKHDVISVENGRKAFEMCQHKYFDLIISDMQMPEMTGFELLSELRKLSNQIPVIIITAFASVEDAVAAVKSGAEDYLTKPLNLQELLLKVQKIQDKVDLINENELLKFKLDKLEFPEMIGICTPMRTVQQMIIKVANDPDVSAMIYGDSGTGKELVARTIHSRSDRSQKPFVAVNCAAFSDELLESELFGHKKGSFTGAHKDKQGLFQAANKGTFFLDEVSEMSPRMQAKLLRVLQEYKIQPVGSTEIIDIDVRIISASNKDLHELVGKDEFREDLYYRFNVIEIKIAPLCERYEDIPLLLHHFLERYNLMRDKNIKFSKNVVSALQEYSWPGNVRELENLVQMLAVTTDSELVQKDDLPEKYIINSKNIFSEWDVICEKNDYKKALNTVILKFEKIFLTHHLKRNLGNISKTAEAIGLSRVALHKKIKDQNIRF